MDGRRWIPLRHRAEQGGDQQRRRDHLPGGGGRGAPVAPGCRGRGGHLHPARDASGDCRGCGGTHAGDPGTRPATAVPARERQAAAREMAPVPRARGVHSQAGDGKGEQERHREIAGHSGNSRRDVGARRNLRGVARSQRGTRFIGRSGAQGHRDQRRGHETRRRGALQGFRRRGHGRVHRHHREQRADWRGDPRGCRHRKGHVLRVQMPPGLPRAQGCHRGGRDPARRGRQVRRAGASRAVEGSEGGWCQQRDFHRHSEGGCRGVGEHPQLRRADRGTGRRLLPGWWEFHRSRAARG